MNNFAITIRIVMYDLICFHVRVYTPHLNDHKMYVWLFII
jgi:hypothetical protein